MNNPLFLSAFQKPCAIPSSVQKNLREKIMRSDFLVADDRGTHRLIGLKYSEKTDCAPLITCVCMRHEMAYAKQIAFSVEKKIFYNSNVSGKLFNCAEGDFIALDFFTDIAKLYAEILIMEEEKQERHSNDIYVSGQGLRIKGRVLKPFFKLAELIDLIGEPDERIWADQQTLEFCSWNELGICSYRIKRVGVVSVYICLKTPRGKNIMPFLGDLYINQRKFSGKKEDGIFTYYKIGRNVIHIGTINEELVYCDIDDADFITIDFLKGIHFAELLKNEQGE